MLSLTLYFLVKLAFILNYALPTEKNVTTFTWARNTSHTERKESNRGVPPLRVKRYIGTDTLFFKESELTIRDQISVTKLDVALLPKFGGKEAERPYANLIQVLTHTRSYQDGPVDGNYGHTTGDTISVSVDPEVHKFTKGKWAIYDGSRHHRCLPQLVYGNGQKVVFACFAEGTYHAFFRVEGTYKDENDLVNGVPYRSIQESANFYGSIQDYNSYFLDPTSFFSEYQQKLLQNDQSLQNPWFYSDPFKIGKDSYCFRWAYRLIKENEVGFVHLEPNPVAISGVYKEYTLKVWIVDPSEVTEEQLYSPLTMYPSSYSQIITRRFHLGGLAPCLRNAHPAIEVVSDATYVKGGDTVRKRGSLDSDQLFGPHWKFRIKVYMDRIVSGLSDIVFTISPRQHTALYECFIADVRVYIRPKSYVFLPNSKVSSTAINLRYSSISEVERRFLSENALHYFGHEALYVGSPYFTAPASTVQVFSNPCINQEFSVSYDRVIGMTSDFFFRNELQKIILPSLEKEGIGLNPDTLRLSEAERKSQSERSNNIFYAKNLSIKVFDFAYSPLDVILLLGDSSLYLHSTDLSLRGIGYNTITRKYKLGGLVKRKWCAKTSTPKSHNMWIPAFSRNHGNFIVIYHIPVEGTRVIKPEEASTSCEVIRDSTKFGRREENSVSMSEREIHADEAEDARIDKAVEAKLRTKAAELKAANRQSSKVKPKVKTLKDVAEDKTFWMVGNEVLSVNDPHYAGGATNARNVRMAESGLEHYNDNIVFKVDTEFVKLRNSFETNGLSFDIDEVVYASGAGPIHRSAPNHRLFSIHSVQFTGVEKRYLLAVGFQSSEFLKTLEFIDSTLVMVTTFLANDLPVVVNGTTLKQNIELEKVDITFSGTLIRRLKSSHDANEPDINALKPSDFVDAQGNDIIPAPLSRITTRVSSINTALPLYVLRINDVILFASLDGSFAKPILCYEDYPTPEQDITPIPFVPFKSFDVLVTEQGVISALAHRESSGSQPSVPARAFIGSVLANEPLRFIQPFHLSNNIFQVATEEGEIGYGNLGYNAEKGSLESPPKTTMLNIPFWSLLKGSFGRSAGDAAIPLDRHVVSEGRRAVKSIADPVCPFAGFDVYYVLFPYVEAQYTTRITAEVAFYGDVIPLEADVIVEFAEVQGVSIVVSSFLEVEYDQTVIRKTIEIETFLPQPQLESMYNRHYSVQNEDEEQAQTEEVRVFTLTIRPSLLNQNCQKRDYFRTIQMNVGCVPFTRMRLIAEALPLRKIPVLQWSGGLSEKDLETNWYLDESNSGANGISHLIIPRNSVHPKQRKISGCENRNDTFCRFRIPAGKDIQDNVYGLSFRDVLVPKFEQFLTQHARRVTGNVVVYDLLDSYNDPEAFRIESNTTQYNAGCLVNGDDWYGEMAGRVNLARNEKPVFSNIYRYFKDCFSRRLSYRQEDIKKTLPLIPIQQLNSVKFFLFNQSNGNAIHLKKNRNYIYVVRAVVVNTEYNRFTYCEKLDTFFVLQVVNIIQQKKVIESYLPYVYLTIVSAIFLVCLICYFYFAKNVVWTVDVEPKKIYDQQEEDKLVDELRKRYDRPRSPYGRLAKRIADLEKIQRGAKEYHTSRLEEREDLIGSSKRSKSESAKDRLSDTSITHELKTGTAKENLGGDSKPNYTTDPTVGDFGKVGSSPKTEERRSSRISVKNNITDPAELKSTKN